MGSLFLIINRLLVTVAYATNPATKYCLTLHPGCGAGRWFIVQIANQVIKMISTTIGGVAVVAFVWGTIRIVSSGGNDEGRNQGKSIITAALIGVFLALMGRAFVTFVDAWVNAATSDVL